MPGLNGLQLIIKNFKKDFLSAERQGTNNIQARPAGAIALPC